MFKTRSPLSKETIVAIGLATLFIVLLIINVAILLPSLFSTFNSVVQKGDQSPIDAQTVNEAIELLNQ